MIYAIVERSLHARKSQNTPTMSDLTQEQLRALSVSESFGVIYDYIVSPAGLDYLTLPAIWGVLW